MLEPSLKLACLAAGAALSVIAATPAQAETSATHYACEGSQNLVVERDGAKARVTFTNRTYVLRRARSSIGAKYLGPSAALIIDGVSAVFVADDRLQLGTCNEAYPIAQAQ